MTNVYICIMQQSIWGGDMENKENDDIDCGFSYFGKVKDCAHAENEKVYILQSGNSNAYKIGRTSRDSQERVKELQTGNPEKLKLVKQYYEPYSEILENNVHKKLKENNINGEFYSDGKKIEKTIREEKEKIDSSIYRLPNDNGDFGINSDYFISKKK